MIFEIWPIVALAFLVFLAILFIFNWTAFFMVLRRIEFDAETAYALQIRSRRNANYYFHMDTSRSRVLHATLFNCGLPLLGSIALCWTKGKDNMFSFAGIHRKWHCGRPQ